MDLGPSPCTLEPSVFTLSRLGQWSQAELYVPTWQMRKLRAENLENCSRPSWACWGCALRGCKKLPCSTRKPFHPNPSPTQFCPLSPQIPTSPLVPGQPYKYLGTVARTCELPCLSLLCCSSQAVIIITAPCTQFPLCARHHLI